MMTNFYPRPPRGGRPQGAYDSLPDEWISIHALREEGDTAFAAPPVRGQKFLSTPSARRATLFCGVTCVIHAISIHALREEGDYAGHEPDSGQKHFYPRPPRGGRQHYIRAFCWCQQFLSTPSARRATSVSLATRTHSWYFYPRPPRGGRRQEKLAKRLGISISIHALREEGDTAQGWNGYTPTNFYPRPPRGGRPCA